MRRRPPSFPLISVPAIGLMVASFGCSAPDEDDAGDAETDVETDAETTLEADVSPSDAETTEEGGSDASPRGGPLIFTVSSFSITTDRLCDLDGDGIADNAVADLGEPSASIFAAAISSGLASVLENGKRLGIHFPWVGDVTAPSASGGVVILYSAADTDDPVDRTDDFSGEEPFYARGRELDGCGEPLNYFWDTIIDGGALSASSDQIVLPLDKAIPIHGGQASGEIEPFGRAIELFVCGFSKISDLGALLGLEEAGGLTMLEVLIGGGASFGLSELPGVSPDVDVDGDGLELFEVNALGEIVSCIDGDRTRIDGRDCWLDPRIADGISLNFWLEGVGARFAGLEPGWENDVVGTCEEGPPEPSLWDPPQ